MFLNRIKAFWITEYFLFSVLSARCLAAAGGRIGENHKAVVSHFSSRSLLDRDDIQKNLSDSDALVYFIFFIVSISVGTIYFLWICVPFLYKACCVDSTRPGTVLQTPLIAPGTTPSYDLSQFLPGTKLERVNGSTSPTPPSSGEAGPCLAPPRSSTSVILPIEGEVFPLHLYGIENPLYLPTNIHSEQNSNVVPIPGPTRQIMTPLCEILDMPPSYTAVLKEDHKYAKPRKSS